MHAFDLLATNAFPVPFTDALCVDACIALLFAMLSTGIVLRPGGKFLRAFLLVALTACPAASLRALCAEALIALLCSILWSGTARLPF